MSTSATSTQDQSNEETVRLVPLPTQQDNEYLLYQKSSSSSAKAAKKRKFTSNLVIPSQDAQQQQPLTPNENEVMTARYLTPNVITMLTPPSVLVGDDEEDSVAASLVAGKKSPATVAPAIMSPAEEEIQQPTFVTGRELQPLWRVIIFCCLPIGINMATWFSTGVLFPLQVVQYVGDGDAKAYLLALSGILIAVACMPCGPVAGFFSDRLLSRLGRRQPWIVIGTICAVLSMGVRPFLPIEQTLWFVVNFIFTALVKIGFTLINSIFLAQVSDIFHESQLGLVGSVNSFIGLLAGGVGVAVLGYLFPIVGAIATCYITVGFMCFNVLLHLIVFRETGENLPASGKFLQWQHPRKTAPASLLKKQQEANAKKKAAAKILSKNSENAEAVITTAHPFDEAVVQQVAASSTSTPVDEHVDTSAVEEVAELPAKTTAVSKICNCVRGLVAPFLLKDFMLVTCSQFLILLAFESTTTFALYYLHDKVGPTYTIIIWTNLATSAEQALSFLMVSILAAALVMSVFMTMISDRFSRRVLLFFSGNFGFVGIFTLVVFTNFNAILVAGAFLGLGAGGVTSVFLGLIVDIVNDKTPDHVAQNMSIFYIGSSVLPKVLSNVVGGAAIGFGNTLWTKGYVDIRLFGYNMLFLVGAILTFAGNVLVLFVSRKYDRRKRARRLKKRNVATTSNESAATTNNAATTATTSK